MEAPNDDWAPAPSARGKQSLTALTLEPRKTLKVLLALSLMFVALDLVRLAWIHFMGPNSYHELWSRFDLDLEQSVPTWFSALILFAAGFFLWSIAAEKRRRHDRFRKHWSGLSLIFLLLSMDEIASFHNRVHMPHYWGPFHYAWVLPAMIFLCLFFVSYLRFLFHLSPFFRYLFIISGAIFVFGAVGLEAVEGQVAQYWGIHLFYHLLTNVEEGCEMIGVSLFIYALLEYLQLMTGQITLALTKDEALARKSENTAAMAHA